MTFGAQSRSVAGAGNGGNTAVSMLLYILSNLLKTAVVEGQAKTSRKRKSSSDTTATATGTGTGAVVTRSSRDLYLKRIVEWVEAIIDSFLPVFAVLLLSEGNGSTGSNTSASSTLKTTFATLLQCINQVEGCASGLESTLGVWVHVCRCGGSSDASGKGSGSGSGGMSAELEETNGSGVSSIGGSSSYLYQTESVFL